MQQGWSPVEMYLLWLTQIVWADNSVFVCITSVADDSQEIYVKRYIGKQDKGEHNTNVQVHKPVWIAQCKICS
jgi:hypothetical protein